MVAVLSRPVVATAPNRRPLLDISEDEKTAVHALLAASGGLTAAEVAAVLRLDELEVEVYLANETGLGEYDYHEGRYFVWYWL